MYYQNYEDYMRSILGYPNVNTYQMPDDYYQQQNDLKLSELENLYPEIYKLVYPMVCKCVENNTKPLTEENINEMVLSISNNIEADFEVNVRMELKNGDVRNPNSKEEKRETRQNNYLNDLIRILLIREFLRRRNPQSPGNMPRPPFPPNRPPIFGRPPFPGNVRPPEPRDYNMYM